MTVLGLRTNAQIIDPKTGYLTRDGFILFESLIQSFNGAGAGVTVDATQTLVNKTVDGDRNTLENIATNSLKDRTGDGNSVVTSNGGSSGHLMAWGANGDAEDGPEVVLVLTTDDADDRYLSRDGSSEATGPIVVASYTVATVPSAADFTQGIIFVSNETGGATLAFSDGSSWRRVQDRAIVS